MRWLLFLSRVALICNLFFLVALSLRLWNWIGSADLQSTIIILGYVLSMLFNPLTVLTCLFVYVLNRQKLAVVPGWLIVTNVVFLFLQLIFVLSLNIDEIKS
ncbi:MAG: hypothetical protein SFU20_15165 [Chitinophagaceae bacterium]|nr:hypothetical protein [Chitinophagaceae bacterium]OYW19179.1 MAG: hypothetical protein B7Z54_04430 [Sphingobacteriales bacterium 12-47-4]